VESNRIGFIISERSSVSPALDVIWSLKVRGSVERADCEYAGRVLDVNPVF